MKTMKYFLMALMFVLPMTSCDSDDDVVINEADLPVAAQTFLSEHFSGVKVSRVEKDKETNGQRFDVLLADGTEVEFDQDGSWTEVDCTPKAVPNAIIPEAIGNYVRTNYPDLLIVQIERESYGYEIDLSNDLDIKFDNQYKVIRIGN